MAKNNRRIGEAAVVLLILVAIFYVATSSSSSSFESEDERETKPATERPKLRGIVPSPSYNKPTEFMVQVYKKQAKERRERLEIIKNEADKDQAYAYLYNNLAPEVYCEEKIKVGTTDDGGKWMCSPQRIPKDCFVYALGISGVITYERDLQKWSQNRCKIIAVDQGKQPDEVIAALEKINGVVVQALIGPEDSETTRTLKGVLDDQGVDAIEILKIDIEGAELTTMKTFLDNFQPAQIMIEVHGNAAQTIAFLQMVASKGYYLAHYEINGRWHNLAEYAFIHESKLQQYHATLMAAYLQP